jgi:peptidyl-prolyl cis-trans isomerase C
MKTLHLLFCSLFLLLPLSSMAEDAPKTENPVMARVNGVAITQDEVQHFIAKQGKVIEPENALRELINVELIYQTAKNTDVMQDKSLMLELKRIRTALIASTYLQQHLQNLEIDDKALEARYQADYLQGTAGTEYNANHILVKTEDEATDIIKQLDDGADFTELAKELSTGPSGEKGGALGWFTASDMVPPFSKATTELTDGKYTTAPVQTQFGWHVILLNKSRKSEPPELDSVRQKLTTAIAADSIKKVLEDLHENAEIEFAEQP